MQTTDKVACPRCGRKQPMQGPDTIYSCAGCRATFDGDPGEGGDWWSDPTKRLEHAERMQKGRRR